MSTYALARPATDADLLGISIQRFDPLAGSSSAYDCTTAFNAAATYAESRSVAAVAGAGQSDPHGTTAIYFPPGVYLITQKETLLRAAFNSKRAGLAFIGAGAGLTQFYYKPTVLDGLTPETPMLTNDAWLQLKFKGISFLCDSTAAGATFMHSNSIQAQQDYLFEDCEWTGSWGNGFYLKGSNNNSEFKFINCAAYKFGIKPFLESVDSDQFLNYNFNTFKYWSCDRPLVRMTLGGHVHIVGLDASDYGTRIGTGGVYPTSNYLFELLGATHAQGVCHFSATNVRVEAKHAQALLLDTVWPQGQITLKQIDYSSQVGNYTYGNIIRVNAATTAPKITIEDSELAGGIECINGVGTYDRQQRIDIVRTVWHQKERPSDIVTYTGGSNLGGRMNVKFRNCVSRFAYTTGHSPAWDFDTASRFAYYANDLIKTVVVHGANITFLPATVRRVILPVGVVITRFRAMTKAGATVETGTATYSLKSTEGSPATIAQVSWANPSLGGFATETATLLPYYTDAADKATVEVVAEADVASNNSDLIFLIEYI